MKDKILWIVDSLLDLYPNKDIRAWDYNLGWRHALESVKHEIMKIEIPEKVCSKDVVYVDGKTYIRLDHQDQMLNTFLKRRGASVEDISAETGDDYDRLTIRMRFPNQNY